MFIFLVVIASALCQLFDDSQYCAVRYRRLCQGKGLHVACQFPNAGPGSSCENYTAIDFGNKLQHYVTHFINRRRHRIASGVERVRGGILLPKPELMMLVEWDRELAFLAQRLSDQCQFVHDDCRATVRYPYAGQSVGEVRWRKSRDTDGLIAQRAVRRVLEAWWGEKRRVTPKQLTSPFRLASRGAVWGHFTQLAVWTLRAVGCGGVRHGSSYPRFLLVCDFSHTNMLGQRTLTPGPLALCPGHTSRKPRSAYPLLCGPVRRSPGPATHVASEDYEAEYEGPDESEPDFLPPSLWSRHDRVYNERIQQNDVKHENGLSRPSNVPASTMKTFGESDESDHRIMEIKKSMYKKPNSSIFSGNNENVEMRTISARDRYKISAVHNPALIDNYRPTVIRHPCTKHHWKQTRDRPRRPGANALLNSQSTVAARHTRLLSAVSLMLDKDGADQLFRDTGFSVAWKKNEG
ncbi:uncharacterized protein LOC101737322 isoform X2 [Bombyx mori]|uniref:SCP domain-containing protein n=2 Tax=Bombyx mori TaxID=7091 RepID=A0A8R2R921_BOMMO|nr:uncharacterized protein LOC101737322 isoform X1 [Bombyx mori]